MRYYQNTFKEIIKNSDILPLDSISCILKPKTCDNINIRFMRHPDIITVSALVRSNCQAADTYDFQIKSKTSTLGHGRVMLVQSIRIHADQSVGHLFDPQSCTEWSTAFSQCRFYLRSVSTADNISSFDTKSRSSKNVFRSCQSLCNCVHVYTASLLKRLSTFKRMLLIHLQPHSFETLRDLTIRHLNTYWNHPML